MIEGLMLLVGCSGLLYYTFKFKDENEMQSKELENMRHYLLNKYQDELKRKYSEKDFDYTANIMDFCLKLRNMDNETLKKGIWHGERVLFRIVLNGSDLFHFLCKMAVLPSLYKKEVCKDVL